MKTKQFNFSFDSHWFSFSFFLVSAFYCSHIK